MSSASMRVCASNLLSAALVPLIFFRLRFLQFSGQALFDRLAWEHLVAHRGVVDEARDDYGRLFQVFGLQPVVDIHIRVVGTGFVFEGILNELESRDTDRIE